MRVSFVAMRDGTPEDYDLIDANDRESLAELPNRILAHLRLIAEDDGAYQIDRLQHALQTATRAERDGAGDEWVVAALIHDIGDLLAPCTHGAYAAEILAPFVSEEVCWVVRHHPLFQRYYFANLSKEQRSVRERYREHEYYQRTIEFCENWDQCSFDPEYDSFPLEHFEPALRRIFAREPFANRD